MTLLTGLLVVWAVFTAGLICLIIYRGLVGMHEDNQLFLGKGETQFEAESQRTVQRLEKLQPYIRYGTALSSVLTLAVAGLWIYQNLGQFR